MNESQLLFAHAADEPKGFLGTFSESTSYFGSWPN